MITKHKDGYHVVSEKGKNLGGPYKTREEAVKRLRQVEFFKHKGRKNSGGYIGLLMLLIGVAIIALVIVRTDLFGGFPTGQTNNKNMIQGGFDAIDEAKGAKNIIEESSRKAAEQ